VKAIYTNQDHESVKRVSASKAQHLGATAIAAALKHGLCFKYNVISQLRKP
jgi:hypothetical protein